jgi:hypothetical protein
MGDSCVRGWVKHFKVGNAVEKSHNWDAERCLLVDLLLNGKGSTNAARYLQTFKKMATYTSLKTPDNKYGHP